MSNYTVINVRQKKDAGRYGNQRKFAPVVYKRENFPACTLSPCRLHVELFALNKSPILVPCTFSPSGFMFRLIRKPAQI